MASFAEECLALVRPRLDALVAAEKLSGVVTEYNADSVRITLGVDSEQSCLITRDGQMVRMIAAIRGSKLLDDDGHRNLLRATAELGPLRFAYVDGWYVLRAEAWAFEFGEEFFLAVFDRMLSTLPVVHERWNRLVTEGHL